MYHFEESFEAVLCHFPQGTACCLTLIPAEIDRTHIDLMWVTVGNIVSPRMREEKYQNRMFFRNSSGGAHPVM